MPKGSSGCLGGGVVLGATSENLLSHELWVGNRGEEAVLTWNPLSPSPAGSQGPSTLIDHLRRKRKLCSLKACESLAGTLRCRCSNLGP